MPSGELGGTKRIQRRLTSGGAVFASEGDMTLYHLTLAVRGRRALARDETERRALVRAIARTGGALILLFCLVDEHLHSVLRTDRAGYLVRDLGRILRNRRPDLELKQPHLEPVGTRSYLRWLVRYLLEQPAKHGLPGHPALWTGGCFQDLVGARLLPGLDLAGLRAELPRLRLRELYEVVGLSPVRLVAADDEALRRIGAARLVESAAEVFAVGPDLTRGLRSDGVQQARALAAWAGCAVGLPPGELAHYLGVTRRSVTRHAAKSVPPAWAGALRRRVALVERTSARVS